MRPWNFTGFKRSWIPSQFFWPLLHFSNFSHCGDSWQEKVINMKLNKKGNLLIKILGFQSEIKIWSTLKNVPWGTMFKYHSIGRKNLQSWAGLNKCNMILRNISPIARRHHYKRLFLWGWVSTCQQGCHFVQTDG